jgi:hypothetical protein
LTNPEREAPLAALWFPPPSVCLAARWSPRRGAQADSRSGFCRPPLFRARDPLLGFGALASRRPVAHSGFGCVFCRVRAARPPRVRAPTGSRRTAPPPALPAPLAPVPRSGDADAAAGPGGRLRRRRRCCWHIVDCALPVLPQLPPPVTRPLPFLLFCFGPLPPGVRARGVHGWLWQELARVCARV